MKRHALFLLLLMLLINSLPICAQQQQSTNTDLMFPNLVINRHHYTKMKEAIEEKGAGKLKMLYITNMRNPANEIINSLRVATPVISRNNNPKNIDISKDMKAIYQLCVTYAFSQEEKYLDKAVEFLSAWATINTADPRMNIHESIYTEAIEGYSLIRNVMDEVSKGRIDAWIKRRADVFVKANDLRDNNWGTCMHQQYYYYGLVLNDQSLINRFKNKYGEWVKNNLYPNGTTTDLLGRDAFAYHAYDLLFFAELCHAMAMYEGYEKADQFYAQDIQWGASIRKSVDFWKPYLLDPKKNPHLEFTETEYAPDKNRSDYNKPYNPAGTIYVVDELYEMDHDLLPAIKKYRGGNEFATWRLALSAMRWNYGDNE